MQELAKQHGVALLRSNETTCTMMGSLISVLNLELAPRITRHGVLVEVYGEGILILGDSGIGKSELAIELVKRGHRLVAEWPKITPPSTKSYLWNNSVSISMPFVKSSIWKHTSSVITVVPFLR